MIFWRRKSDDGTAKTMPPGDKHYVAKVLERKDLSEDLWLIRVDPAARSASKRGNTRRWALITREKS